MVTVTISMFKFLSLLRISIYYWYLLRSPINIFIHEPKQRQWDIVTYFVVDAVKVPSEKVFAEIIVHEFHKVDEVIMISVVLLLK